MRGEGGDKDGEACKEMVDKFVMMVRECSGVLQEDLEEYGLFPSAIAQEHNKLDCDTMACVKMTSLLNGGRQTAAGHDADASWIVNGHTETCWISTVDQALTVVTSQEEPWRWDDIANSQWR